MAQARVVFMQRAFRRITPKSLATRPLGTSAAALPPVDPVSVLRDADVERFSLDGAVVLRGVYG